MTDSVGGHLVELRGILAHARDIERDAADGCHGDVAVALPALVQSLEDLAARVMAATQDQPPTSSAGTNDLDGVADYLTTLYGQLHPVARHSVMAAIRVVRDRVAAHECGPSSPTEWVAQALGVHEADHLGLSTPWCPWCYPPAPR